MKKLAIVIAFGAVVGISAQGEPPPPARAVSGFFRDFTAATDKVTVGEDEVRLAAAALLFHVVAVDGVVAPEERAVLADLLKRRFDLDAAETGSLVAMGSGYLSGTARTRRCWCW